MFKSVEEINKAFSEHLDSLRMSGFPFDEKGLRAEWSEAIENFNNGLTTPPWADSL